MGSRLLTRLMVAASAPAVRRELELVPTPVDRSRQLVAGDDTDRVLVIGSGIARGYGVRSQELALPGRLAAELSRRTGRGTAVDVITEAVSTARSLPALLDGAHLRKYDAIIVAVGAADAARFLDEERWSAALGHLLDRLGELRGTGTDVTVLSAYPVAAPQSVGTRGLQAVDIHARRLDAVTAEACRVRPDTSFAQTAVAGEPARRWSSAEDYALLAERLAPALARRLDALAAHPPVGSARAHRRAPDPEPRRQAAVDAGEALGRPAGAELDRLLRSAVDAFGARGAAVTLIDGDRQWHKASVGFEAKDLPRSVAVCSRTIEQDGAYVVPDLLGDPFAEQGWRFYAGYPLEAPDGMRIGALCVLDDAPRTATSIDRILLAELANRAQTELWAELTSASPA